MNCGRPDCNGVHDRARPWDGLCEGAKERARAAKRRRYKTPGTHDYNAAHGIGHPGEVMRKAFRRRTQTPDTYAYNRCHGVGVPGLHRWLQRRTKDLLSERPIVKAKLVEVRAEIARLKEGVQNGRGC